jgi:phosphoserine phosphatase RsbU/P
MPNTVYQWERCLVAPGGRLYIFSDGIYEIYPTHDDAPLAINLEAPQLGLNGFIDLLTHIETQRQLSLDSIIQQVSHFGGNHFHDDLSLLEIAF